MPERCLTFECQDDTLVGVLHEPADPARDVGVLVIVGGPQYRVGSHRQFVIMARRLAQAGFPVLRFDYRGMGDSDGSPHSFIGVNADVRGALEAFCAAQPAIKQVVLFGLCDAASAALFYCNSDRRVAGLILVNPWVRTESGQAKAYVRHYYGRRLLQADFWNKLIAGELEVVAAARSLAQNLKRSLSGRRQATVEAAPVSGTHFVDQMRHSLARFQGRVLLLTSDRDLTAREFEGLCQADRSWRELVRLENVTSRQVPDADHTFSTPGSLDRSIQLTLDWLLDRHRI